MTNTREITDLPLNIYTDALPRAGVSNAQVTAIMGALSNTCKPFYGFFKNELADRALIIQLWQAVIDDKRATIVELSKKRPDLFYQLITQGMPNNFIIESKQTFEKLDLHGETLLSATIKRKQLKVVKTLLLCCGQLKKTLQLNKAIKDALSQWKFYNLIKNEENEEEIDIPKEYLDYAQSLIDVFKTETFPNGKPWTNGVFGKVLLSAETELVLTSLLDRLAPKEPVKLDNHVDLKLLLLAINKAYLNNFQSFNLDMTKMSILILRLIGLAQSGQIPEIVEIDCDGLEDTVKAMRQGKEKEISASASEYKLKSGEAVRRVSRDSRVGLGFDFSVDLVGTANLGLGSRYPAASGPYEIWQNYLMHEQNFFKLLLSTYVSSEAIIEEITYRPQL